MVGEFVPFVSTSQLGFRTKAVIASTISFYCNHFNCKTENKLGLET